MRDDEARAVEVVRDPRVLAAVGRVALADGVISDGHRGIIDGARSDERRFAVAEQQ